MTEARTATHRSRSLRQLGSGELSALAREIREFLIATVCRQGGHLGPNLGVVELTIALHRVFSSPEDRILFDTGHQAYVHKILTGRQEWFSGLRTRGGLSGYPSQAESVHDVIENSHASTALSYADGLARADELAGVRARSVVAVVGDGALTGGMCWEALNNIGASHRPIVLVLNDNGRSYGPTLGGLAAHLRDLRTPGATPSIFEQLGFAHLGPVDGHDVAAVERALREARGLRRPVVVHCLTQKGKGYAPAESDDADRMHAIGVIDPVTGVPPAVRPTWTDVFGEEIAAIGAERPDVVCLTAAMLLPTGLGRFAERFPDRVVDAGIAEQHVVTTAAGLALGGCRPVVAVYSTFLNRAFDQVVMDVALHRLPVTFVLDRAGVTGPDGPSHHGVWDVALLAAVPGLRATAPRDPRRLRELLREAVGVTSGPTVVRFPKSVAGEEIEAVGQVDGVDVLHRSGPEDVLLVSIGPNAAVCLDAARELAVDGIGVTVVDPRWIVPAPRVVVALAGRYRLVLTVEDGGRTGGAGSLLAQAVTDAGIAVPVHNLGLPRRFLPHASRQELLAEHGFSGGAISAAVRAGLAGEPVYRHDPDLPPERS
ncbi:1-deoxy-D-xylulose-5-phosphate synthase [Lentzea sp. BCCO 10_0061]|uniref:1-deoxy-D-xylulose-5-phosphate synthase n=1 Tax=Lentzea sokolovensis TaxID=3095429 RepID=A0ABU4VF24_9PSEU|nr:1-deoxy-D-xylulose-5-phosphate synthase [Lentzea sp. BCCO 10_0061]MDX8149480.1 1-deoxy-D-xylulose-5-phosphate synthase [Lentzea sp. BCCO 10_0061]